MAKSMREMLQQAAAANMAHRTAPETFRRNDAIEAEEHIAKLTAPINLVAPNSTTKKYNQEVQPDIPDGTTKQSLRSYQEVQPHSYTKKSNQKVQPRIIPEDMPNLVKGKIRSLTQQQQRVLDHLKAQGPHITDKAILSEKLGIAPYTVRNILIRLTALGMIERKRSGQGMLLKVIGQSQNNVQSAIKQYNLKVQPNSTTTQYQLADPLRRDRKILSISLETLQTSWPTLARAGFGLDQIKQIHNALDQLGKSADRIVQGLDHAEWELAQGKMTDKAGQSVADPCAWVYRSLASQGYYRRPVGYVSAQEQAERDAEDEAKALARRREAARQERFRAWLQGLSVDERKNALAGKLGGSDEAWLKSVWSKRGEPA